MTGCDFNSKLYIKIACCHWMFGLRKTIITRLHHQPGGTVGCRAAGNFIFITGLDSFKAWKTREDGRKESILCFLCLLPEKPFTQFVFQDIWTPFNDLKEFVVQICHPRT